MRNFRFIFASIFFEAFIIIGIGSVEIELRKYYRIQNADSTVLTVGGENVENVKIITSDKTDTNSKRQVFWIGSRVGIDQSIYEISPEAQNIPLSLVLEENTESNLLYQKIRHFRNTQWWRIIDIGNGNWHILNDRSNLCLASQGNGNQVVSEICNLINKSDLDVYY